MPQYTKIVEQPGSMRLVQDISHIQDILSQLILNHAKNKQNSNWLLLSMDDEFIINIEDDRSEEKASQGLYSISFDDGTLTVSRNGTLIDTFTDVVAGDTIESCGFTLYLAPNLSTDSVLSCEIAVYHAEILNGLVVTFDGSDITVNSGTIAVNGYVINVAEQIISVGGMSAGDKYLAMNVQLTEVAYTTDASYLGHYIVSEAAYDEKSPSAIKLSYSLSVQTTPVLTADTSTSFWVVLAKTTDTPTITRWVRTARDMFRERFVVFEQLTPRQISRLKSIADGLTIDLDDGNGEREIETHKVPSIPNQIAFASIGYTIKPFVYTVSTSVKSNLKLREIETINKSVYLTQLSKLYELKAAAIAASSMSELTTLLSECLDIGAITQAEYDVLSAYSDPDDVATDLGDEDSGIVKNKYGDIDTSTETIESYEQSILSESEKTTGYQRTWGRLTINWSKPTLVDDEEIIFYKVKLIRVTASFSETSSSLLSTSYVTPKKFLDESTFQDYITKSEPVFDTDRLSKTVSGDTVVYVEEGQTLSAHFDVTPKEKVVVYIRPVTEFDIEGPWSDPLVINVPGIVVDAIEGTTFEEYEDDNAIFRNKLREVERSSLVSSVNDKISEIQISLSDFATRSELEEGLSTKADV